MSDVVTKATEQDDELMINDVYLQCLDSFMACSDCLHLSAASRQLVNDERSRFKIWAANIGAHLDPSVSSSLDHRLRNSERTKTSVTLLLRVMRVNIDYATRIFDESEDTLHATASEIDQDVQVAPSGYQVEEGMEHKESQRKTPAKDIAMRLSDEALSSVHAMIGQLKRMSNAIKRASLAEYSLRAARNRDLKHDPARGAEYETFARNIVQYKFKDATESGSDTVARIQQALINGVEFRLRRFRDWERHHDKQLNLERRRAPVQSSKPDYPTPLAEELEGAQPRSLGTDTAHQSPGGPSERPPEVESSVLSQKSFDSRLLETTRSTVQSTNASKSVRSVIGNTYVDWPRPPKKSYENDDIKCPYCFDRLESVELTNKTQWRQHVKRDLEPYNCLEQGCQEHLRMFASEEQWINHIRTCHSHGTWICRLKPHQEAEVFEDEATVREHLQTQHEGMVPKSRVETLIRSMHRPGSGNLFKECPLNCLDHPSTPESNHLTKHIANHLLSLAMEALPERSVASSQTSFLESDEDLSEIMPVSKGHTPRRKDIDELPDLDFEAGGRIEGINEQDVEPKLAIALDNRKSVSLWIENLSYNQNLIDSQKRKTWALSDRAKRWKVLLTAIAFIIRSQRVTRMNLLEAASRGSRKQVLRLLQRGADVGLEDENGETALSHAARSGYHATVKLLLLHGADINSKDDNGETALSHAARNGYDATVKLLLSYGADVNSKDRSGETALSYAARNSHKVIAKLLLSHGASWTLTQSPSVSGDYSVAFLEHGETVTETVQDDMVSISVGKIHGIYAGTQYVSTSEPSTTVEITEVDDCESRAKVIGGGSIEYSSKPLWFLPRRLGKAEVLEVTIDPDLGPDFRQHLVGELNKRLAGQFSCLEGPQAVVQETTERFLIHLKKEVAGIDICGQRWLFGNEGHIHGWKIEGQTDKEQAVNSARALRHLFRFGQILQLQSKSEDTGPFNISLTSDGERSVVFTLKYENIGKEELYFSFIALTSGFQVQQLYPVRDVAFRTPAGYQGSIKFRLIPPMPPGESGASEVNEHRDIIRTIVVRGAGISMKSIELPDIWDTGKWEKQAVELSGKAEPVQDLHWWVHDQTLAYKA
ncbi:tetratricopeptide repeat domain-containing protein [Fusarium flagelliforme]|uniref:Tetratricopeptide repeat domain-containing protein n=1 Tax=Fusarium flagelliforme TaxID=2675880 RepID=A0A395MCA0_9HYPO|nr:tetratricopeptide repeat domain-containing protein [Fusarium flagelliforme]